MNKFVKSLIISFLFVLVAASFTACFGESSPKTAEFTETRADESRTLYARRERYDL